jgi:hypothetical protein
MEIPSRAILEPSCLNFDHAITPDANSKRPSHASLHTVFRNGGRRKRSRLRHDFGILVNSPTRGPLASYGHYPLRTTFEDVSNKANMKNSYKY